MSGVKLRFRLLPIAALIHASFATVWLGAIGGLLLLSIFAPSRVGGLGGGANVFLFLFFALGLFLFIRRRTIAFDFRNGWVKISTPGEISRARPVVHGFELTTRKTRAGWRTNLMYGACEIARTAPMPDPESARARLYPFAVALNQQLGMTILDEKRVSG